MYCGVYWHATQIPTCEIQNARGGLQTKRAEAAVHKSVHQFSIWLSVQALARTRFERPETRRSKNPASGIKGEILSQKRTDLFFKQTDKRRVHKFIVVRNTKTNNALAIQMTAVLLAQLGPVGLFHDENDIRPFQLLR